MGSIGLFLRQALKRGVFIGFFCVLTLTVVSGEKPLTIFLAFGHAFTPDPWGAAGIGFLLLFAIGVIAGLLLRQHWLLVWVLKRVPKYVLDDPEVKWITADGTRSTGILRKKDGEWGYVMQFYSWFLAFSWRWQDIPVGELIYTGRKGRDHILSFVTGNPPNGKTGEIEK